MAFLAESMVDFACVRDGLSRIPAFAGITAEGVALTVEGAGKETIHPSPHPCESRDPRDPTAR